MIFFFETGVQLVMGRTFLDEEYELGAQPVVILSRLFAQLSFGVDTTLLGRTLELDGESFTIVGLMPQEFMSSAGVQLWVPARR